MTEQDLGSKPFEEIALSPEDYANLVEIVSWVNQVIYRQYPNFPQLSIEQLKVIPNIAAVRMQVRTKICILFSYKKLAIQHNLQ